MMHTQLVDEQILTQWVCTDQFRWTASTNSTPGGESIAAISAALGLGLVAIGLEITAKRPEMAASSKQFISLLREARNKKSALERHATADATISCQYIQVLRQPNQTPEQKATREKALRLAMIKAIEAPLAAAQDMCIALMLAEAASSITHLRVIRNVSAGAALLKSAITASLTNVDINLQSIPEPEVKERYAALRGRIADDAQVTAARVAGRIGARIVVGR